LSELSLRLSYKSQELRKIRKNIISTKTLHSLQFITFLECEQGKKLELSDIPQGNRLMLTQVITALKDINKPSPHVHFLK